MKNTMKVVRWPLLMLCIVGIVLGTYFLMVPETQLIYSEKIAFCDNGDCEISSLQRYSDGSAAGSSTSGGVSEDWVKDWLGYK